MRGDVLIGGGSEARMLRTRCWLGGKGTRIRSLT